MRKIRLSPACTKGSNKCSNSDGATDGQALTGTQCTFRRLLDGRRSQTPQCVSKRSASCAVSRDQIRRRGPSARWPVCRYQAAWTRWPPAPAPPRRPLGRRRKSPQRRIVREFLHWKDVVLQQVIFPTRGDFSAMVTSQEASSPVLFGGTKPRPNASHRLLLVPKRERVATPRAVDQVTGYFQLSQNLPDP
jgi:hypothetical protein